MFYVAADIAQKITGNENRFSILTRLAQITRAKLNMQVIDMSHANYNCFIVFT